MEPLILLKTFQNESQKVVKYFLGIFFMQHIEKQIEQILERNKKVEAEKAWETSWHRKLTIVVITYITVVSFLLILGFERPFISAVVPCIGYILSTFSLGWMKEKFLQKFKK